MVESNISECYSETPVKKSEATGIMNLLGRWGTMQGIQFKDSASNKSSQGRSVSMLNMKFKNSMEGNILKQ